MPEHIDEILDLARQHCEEVVKPNVDRWNEIGKWPRDASDQAARMGLTGLYCPTSLGGQGLPLNEGVRVFEELGKGDAAYGFTLAMHNACCSAVCNSATDSFKNEWATDLISARKLGNFALTEPQSGSDPATMYTIASVNDDGSFTINGSKAWISLANEADVYLVVTKTSDEPGYKDMAMIAVPANTPGLSFGPVYDTPSYRFLPLSEMYLKNVTVPAENLILPVGKGLSGSLAAIDISRVSIAAGCCGLIQSALDIALSYAKNRKMYGGTSIQLDGIQWMLGEVATDLEIARLLYRKAADALGSEDGPLMAAHAKLYVPDAALRAANTCTQILGGMGLLRPYGLDRLSRLAQMLKIVDGTTEIQRVVIGRALQKRAAKLPDLPVPEGFQEGEG